MLTAVNDNPFNRLPLVSLNKVFEFLDDSPLASKSNTLAKISCINSYARNQVEEYKQVHKSNRGIYEQNTRLTKYLSNERCNSISKTKNLFSNYKFIEVKDLNFDSIKTVVDNISNKHFISLNFQSCYFEFQTQEKLLSKIPVNLINLVLERCFIQDLNITDLLKMLPKNLKALNLSYSVNFSKINTHEVINYFNKIFKLEELKLAGCLLNLDFFKIVCESKLSNLNSLDVSENDLSEKNSKFSEIKQVKLKSLVCLAMRQCHLSSATVQWIVCKLFSSLEKLDISDNPNEPNDVDFTNSIKSSLKNLSFKKIGLKSPDVMSLFSNSLLNLKLRKLDLAYNDLGFQSLTKVFSLEFPYLKTLNVSHVRTHSINDQLNANKELLEKKSSNFLSKINCNFPFLKYLSLEGNNLIDCEMDQILQQPFPRLTALEMQKNKLSCDFLEDSLPKNAPKLEMLNMSSPSSCDLVKFKNVLEVLENQYPKLKSTVYTQLPLVKNERRSIIYM